MKVAVCDFDLAPPLCEFLSRCAMSTTNTLRRLCCSFQHAINKSSSVSPFLCTPSITQHHFHTNTTSLYSRKFEKIKGKKAVSEVRRTVIHSKISREIQSAVSAMKNDDPEINYRLKLALDNAKRNALPKAAIDKAIQNGLQEKSGDTMEQIWYAGRMGRICIMARALADRHKRQATTNYLKHIFTSNGGTVGEPKSVEFAFQRKGIFIFPEGTELDQVMDDCIESNAEDVYVDHEGQVVCLCEPNDYFKVKAELEKRGYTQFQESGVIMHPMEDAIEYVKPSTEVGQQLRDLLDDLDDHEDVQVVYTNVRWEKEDE